MSQQKLLASIVGLFDKQGIPYMLTGSLVSSLYGEPRSTHDIDVVVALSGSSSKKLIDAFPSPRFYVEESSILSAIDQKGMFNIIDSSEGDKIDCWILTDESFDQSRFLRRKTEELFGMKVSVTTPEDTVLAKLKWAKESGGSQKHFTDALRVYEVQHEILDFSYLKLWVETLHVRELWEKMIKEAEIP